jgi:hypothetical protein
MEFEDELTELFDSATATLRPPIDEIVERSTAQGLRLHRRRRNTKVALGACGVTAIVCGTALGVVHEYPGASSAVAVTGARRTPGTASASPVAPTGVASTASQAPGTDAPSPSTTTYQSPTTLSTPTASVGPTGASGDGAAGGATDYELLKSLLPAGADLTPMPYDWGGVVPGAADAVYDDGHGKSAISVMTASSSQAPAFSCSSWAGGQDEGRRPVGATPVSCATVRLPNGDTRTTVVTGVDEYGFYDYEVSLRRTDGTVVIATAGNGVPEGADVVVTRAVPPLTLARLQTIAADPGWHLS